MILTIIRHPETKCNIERKIQGHKDSPLTELGTEIATDLAFRLQDLDISEIIASNLGRCVQTAKIIADETDVPVSYTMELRERNFGDYNGKENAFIRQQMDMHDPDVTPPNGESFREMQSRVLDFVRTLEGSTEGSLLLVTHEGCLRAILSNAYNCDHNDARCNTVASSIYRFDLNGGKLQFIESY